MKFAVNDRVRLKRDMFDGKLPKGSLGTVREAGGLVTYKVKFDGFPTPRRVLEQDLERA